ncbi:endogenous retrovirus group K member 8 Gag polyprotein-like [Manacus candei]|uniref:endogenous retrovirus group K member 8 Gag polyprotein-like n=1 Tax=Manacus candei TaxID=415023 RepID=UPI002225F8F9|nr:endogenous retrovirus group K member 8 Gag polyprotein-like [Manacus candei]
MLDELMGFGPYTRIEAQALIGPDKIRESMRLARLALDKIKAPGGIPSYMGIKQGRDEPFGSFIDRVANAIQLAGVPEYMHGALLKQCALQNCNSTARNVIVTLPGNWSIEELLEQMAQIPQGPNAMLVNAVKELGESLKEQAKAISSQVLAALAPLQAPTGATQRSRPAQRRCFRCGAYGHVRRECQSGPVWCSRCQQNTHVPAMCWRGSGNGKVSAKGSRAKTQVTAPATHSFPAQTSHCIPQPEGASAWTWQPQ